MKPEIDTELTPNMLRETAIDLILHAEEMDGATGRPNRRHRVQLRAAILAHSRYGNHPIIRIVAEHFKLHPFAFFRPDRRIGIVMPRHILAYLLYRDIENWSEVARMLAREHSTIMHSHRVVTARAKSLAFAAMLNALQARCRAAQAAEIAAMLERGSESTVGAGTIGL